MNKNNLEQQVQLRPILTSFLYLHPNKTWLSIVMGHGLALAVLVRKIWQQDRLIPGENGRRTNLKNVYSELPVQPVSSVSPYSVGKLLQMDGTCVCVFVCLCVCVCVLVC